MGISLEDAYSGQPSPQDAVPTPSTGISLEDAYNPPPAPAPPGLGADLAGNVATGIADVPGAILSLPHTLAHYQDWVAAKGLNLLDGGNRTGADIDQYNGAARITPTADDVNGAVFKGLDTTDRALGGEGVAPYVPTTLPGKIGQAAVTGAAAGLLDPMADVGAAAKAWNALKAGASTGTGAAAQQLDPENPVIGPVAAIIAHAGMSAAGANLAGVNESIVRPFYDPRGAGKDTAGVRLASVDNTAPGLANPSPADVAGAAGSVRTATDDLGPGLSTPAAMTRLQDTLVARQGTLQDAKAAAVSPLYQAFRNEPPVPPSSIPPNIANAPAFTPAVGSAATDMLNGANRANNPYGSPTAPYTDYNAAGDPVFTPGGLTPDLLGRAATKLGAQASDARRTSSDSGLQNGLTAASSALTDFLKARSPNFAAATDMNAAMSRPLDVFDQPRIARAIDQTTNAVGAPLGYTQEPTSLLDSIAASKDPGPVVQQFIDAAGGDKAAVTGPIQDAIVGRLRDNGVIDPQTGEVNAKALAQETRKYLPTLGMYLPELPKKFGTATAAQATLDNMKVQEGLARDVATKGLRDSDGVVTSQSMGNWMRQNQQALGDSQGQAALMRLGQIRNALGKAPGGAADAIATEVLPSIISDKIGGSENAILAVMGLHKIGETIASGRLAKYREAYSQAVENAVSDPVYAKRIIEDAAKRPSLTSGAAIRTALGRAAFGAMQAGAITSGLPSTRPSP